MSVWDDVVGQPQAVGVLRSAARAAREVADGGARSSGMTHAWLITGPPGSGRSVAARAFAAALACTDPDDIGCGRCHGCTTTLGGTHADLQVITTEQIGRAHV